MMQGEAATKLDVRTRAAGFDAGLAIVMLVAGLLAFFVPISAAGAGAYFFGVAAFVDGTAARINHQVLFHRLSPALIIARQAALNVSARLPGYFRFAGPRCVLRFSSLLMSAVSRIMDLPTQVGSIPSSVISWRTRWGLIPSFAATTVVVAKKIATLLHLLCLPVRKVAGRFAVQLAVNRFHILSDCLLIADSLFCREAVVGVDVDSLAGAKGRHSEIPALTVSFCLKSRQFFRGENRLVAVGVCCRHCRYLLQSLFPLDKKDISARGKQCQEIFALKANKYIYTNKGLISRSGVEGMD
jgi:uncharacterized membrane protein HdeD (DUF308 family)